MTIQLKYACLEYTEYGCVSRMAIGGEAVPATPHDSPHYYVIAHRCGYGDDILAYCREHEFCHHFVEEALHERPSRVIGALALGSMFSGPQAAYEEMAAQSFQRWLRSNERPIVSGVDWDALKDRALSMLQGRNEKASINA